MDIAVNVEATDTSTPSHSSKHWDSSNKRVGSSPRRSADIRLIRRHPEVYEPCDDSFALVDALLADRVHLRGLKPSFCVEVGCGSGYVITSLALILGNDQGKAYFLATDINEAAAKVTCDTLAVHDVAADVIVTDLVSGLEKRLSGLVDVLVFNPPYVPTPDEDVGTDGITASWAGGERGRTVIDRILAIVDMLLSNRGWFYLLTITVNNPGEICHLMKQKGFASRIVVQRYTQEESLHVLKFWRAVATDHSDSASVSSTSRTSRQQSLSQRLSRLVSFK
eukprot:c29195_g1_i3 orf=234-1073(+)